jgi:hypothetical protein
MECWDGFFEIPGQAPVVVPSSHVPARSDAPAVKAEAVIPDLRILTRYDLTAHVVFGSMVLSVVLYASGYLLPLIPGPALSTTISRIVSTASLVFGIVAMLGFMKCALELDLMSMPNGLPAGRKAEPAAIQDVCHEIRGAHRLHRPSGGALSEALIEATHRCCRIVSIGGSSQDLEVVETIALVRSRLPSILDAYERTKAVADPKEAWEAVDTMARAVVMLGDQAETARLRLLAAATDGLDTEIRYLSARTGRTDAAISSMLSPVN